MLSSDRSIPSDSQNDIYGCSKKDIHVSWLHVFLGLGTETTYLGLGKYYGLC